MAWTITITISLILLVFVFDRTNSKHTIHANFPIIGWIRRAFETIGPEIRQYFVASNREELPFNRVQRAWIYATSKMQNNTQGFGTDLDMYQEGHVIILHSADPVISYPHTKTVNYLDVRPIRVKPNPDAFKALRVIGAHRTFPYRPNIVNVSAMSYGALSPTAVQSLNRGAGLAGSFHNTGEGGYHSEFHAVPLYGTHTSEYADVVYQIGTGYFGCRNDDGSFSLERFLTTVRSSRNIKMIEIKLSQGAKAKGGILPGAKVDEEIARARGIKEGEDAISPSKHSAFSSSPESLIAFIELLARETGLPVGIKSAVSHAGFWRNLFEAMAVNGHGPDFITIDGGEGGTGAAPPSFAGHVSLPLNEALMTVKNELESMKYAGRFKDSKFRYPFVIASAKLGFPEQIMKAMAMGADSVNVAREALMSIGCIQAQKCHTNHCPAGIATQSKWLYKGINPTDKGARCSNYLLGLMEETFAMAAACGFEHPNQVTQNTVLIRQAGKLVPLHKI